ncbi:MAG: hypothetical protein ACYDEN_04560, partial [Acidimicrobiales bacterium]
EQGGHAELPEGHWIAAASRWGTLARRWAEVTPPVLEGCSLEVAAGDEQRLRDAYLAGDLRAAVAAVPVVGEPWVLLGLREEDAAHARRGGALLREWATPWDKRLDLATWTRLAEAAADPGPLPGDLRGAVERLGATGDRTPSPAPGRRDPAAGDPRPVPRHACGVAFPGADA